MSTKSTIYLVAKALKTLENFNVEICSIVQCNNDIVLEKILSSPFYPLSFNFFSLTPHFCRFFCPHLPSCFVFAILLIKSQHFPLKRESNARFLFIFFVPKPFHFVLISIFLSKLYMKSVLTPCLFINSLSIQEWCCSTCVWKVGKKSRMKNFSTRNDS